MSYRLALAFSAALALPAAAQEMTADERAAFRAEVRAYLMENPEVLMEAIGVLEQREATAAAQADSDMVSRNAAALFDDGHSFVGGNPDGDITIVEFMDYRCGYCKRAHPEVTALLAADPNIRYVIKEFPILGEQSDLASRYAIAVQLMEGDETYKTVHDTLIEFRGDVSDASLSQVSGAFGFDHAALSDLMAGPEVSEIIAKNRQLGQQLQISGTPSFVFEDQMVRGYVPLAQMEAIVAQVRADAG
ncbi:DsbA family protein [Yoonia sp. 208BN28-4]|uniref:DsbA family protein n=1 Tax=Yoonia sp. 208BN28-4 TaxID=3126505 RepID=UPI0030994474